MRFIIFVIYRGVGLQQFYPAFISFEANRLKMFIQKTNVMKVFTR